MEEARCATLTCLCIGAGWKGRVCTALLSVSESWDGAPWRAALWSSEGTNWGKAAVCVLGEETGNERNVPCKIKLCLLSSSSYSCGYFVACIYKADEVNVLSATVQREAQILEARNDVLKCSWNAGLITLWALSPKRIAVFGRKMEMNNSKRVTGSSSAFWSLCQWFFFFFLNFNKHCFFLPLE